MGWKHHQVGSELLYPPINSSLQISNFKIHRNFNISNVPQFNLSFEKKKKYISIQKYPKITQKCTQNRLIVVNEMSREI